MLTSKSATFRGKGYVIESTQVYFFIQAGFVCVFSNVHAASNTGVYPEWQRAYCPTADACVSTSTASENDACMIHRANREFLTALIWKQFSPHVQLRGFKTSHSASSRTLRKRERVGGWYREQQMWGMWRNYSRNSFNAVQLSSGFLLPCVEQTFCWERESHRELHDAVLTAL